MSQARPKNSDARQRLLETAERLFYSDGIHVVGIDRIIAEAGVAKMTLYNHFGSKDDLVLEVLRHREQQVNAMFAKSIQRYTRRGKSPLEAFFGGLKDWFKGDGFRGCSFINATAELADAAHPASQFSAAHKERIHEMLRGLIVEAAGESAAEVAPAIALLVEGAIVMAVMERSAAPADRARDAALALVSTTS
ncbi:MAG: TetR/AcrR family transcriptional regulator [Planctomycetota bacterium]